MIPDEAVEAAARSLHNAEKGPWTSGWAIHPGGVPWGTSREAARHDVYLDRARAVLEAAAPHMTRMVTTVEELSALPDDSVVLDDMDGPLTKVGDWWHSPSGEMETWNVILPATVLYEPL